MIASVRGRVVALTPSTAVLEVAGMGVQVQCAPGTLAGLQLGDEGAVATSLVVREDSLTLFGFADDDERSVFELLQTASGVGPRLAQAMLAVHSPDSLRRAVAGEDLASLTRVPGIGRKGAQRIILELKDRLGPPAPAVSLAQTVRGAGRASGSGAPGWRDQVHTGLVGLGWSARDAEAAVETVTPLADEMSQPVQASAEDGSAEPAGGAGPDVAILLRAALQALARA